MLNQYKIHDTDRTFFITLSTVLGVDVFTKKNYKLSVLKALRHCQQEKGLELFAYCLLSDQLHLVCRAREGYQLHEIIVDFKKSTTQQVIDLVLEEGEKGRKWMLDLLQHEFPYLHGHEEYAVWNNGYHAEEIITNWLLNLKLNYLHTAPVKAMIVQEPREYLFSSARDFNHEKGLLKIKALPQAPGQIIQ